MFVLFVCMYVYVCMLCLCACVRVCTCECAFQLRQLWQPGVANGLTRGGRTQHTCCDLLCARLSCHSPRSSHLNASNCLLTSYLPGIWIMDRRVLQRVNLYLQSSSACVCAEMDLSIVEAGHQSNSLLGPKWSHLVRVPPHRPT